MKKNEEKDSTKKSVSNVKNNSSKTNATTSNSNIPATNDVAVKAYAGPGGGVGSGSLINYYGPDYLYEDYDEYREELESVIAAINTSKSVYDSNISSLTSSANSLDDTSPVMCALAEWLTDELSALDYDSEYEGQISTISNFIENNLGVEV